MGDAWGDWAVNPGVGGAVLGVLIRVLGGFDPCEVLECRAGSVSQDFGALEALFWCPEVGFGLHVLG